MSDDKKRKIPYSTPNQDGSMRASGGSGQIPPGKSLAYLETLPADEAASPARKMLKEMLQNPEPSYDPNDKNSLFWAVGRKFTGDMKVKFLQATAKYGRVGLAAHCVGISPSSVLEHRKKDKRFDDLVRDAESFYRESTAAVIMQQAREGLVERKWNSQGQLISERRTYETQLRIKLLDWCDPSFNAPQKQEIQVKGGAVMVPGPVDSVEDWNNVLASLNAIEAEKAASSLPAPTTGTFNLPTESKYRQAHETSEPVTDDEDSFDNIANCIQYEIPGPDDITE